MWQLVIDMRILRGEDEAEPRLLRHVQNIEYGKRAAGRPQDLEDVQGLEASRKYVKSKKRTN
jgi:hypothetical protein